MTRQQWAHASAPILDQHRKSHGHFDKPHTPSQHAFIMMGRETLFIAHLTMYGMEEHNFQLVLQARLPSEAMRQYNEDRQSHPNNTYFLGK